MHDDEVRRLLAAEDEEQTFEGVRKLWYEIGPSVEHLIGRLLPVPESANDRRIMRREIVVSLWANRQQLAAADNPRKRALELSLVEAAWFLQYSRSAPAQPVR